MQLKRIMALKKKQITHFDNLENSYSSEDSIIQEKDAIPCKREDDAEEGYINEEETYDEDPPFIVRGNGITCIALDELVEFLKKHSK